MSSHSPSGYDHSGPSHSSNTTVNPTTPFISTTNLAARTMNAAFPFAFPPSVASADGATLTRHPSRSAPSHLSKIYRQASTLFLTRRLPEALTTIAAVIAPPQPVSASPTLGRDASPDTESEPAPVATASRTTRIKVWSLYLTIVNAVLEMEPGEGKDAFGAKDWRALCAKVKEGGIWDEVVKNGYHGVEGSVDSDVVINLATLLLAHARSQSLSQKRLEAYLATADAPNLDSWQHDVASSPVSSRPSSVHGAVGPRAQSHHRRSKSQRRLSGAHTPRDLIARVKILELYTLHVLPRNNEWDCAREFISASAVLDDERREAFLQALQSLQEQQQEQETQEYEEDKAKRDETVRGETEVSEKARGEAAERQKRDAAEQERQGEKERSQDKERGGTRQSTEMSRVPRAAKRAGPPGLGTRAGMVLWNMKGAIGQLGASLVGNSAVLTRLVMFMIGFLLMISHQGARNRVRRIVAMAWMKVKATAGMGVKTTYI